MITERALDMRGMPVWERAEAVLARADRLSDGERFEFVIELDPHALIARLEMLRPGALSSHVRRVGADEWRVALGRLRPEDGNSPLSQALKRSAAFSGVGDDTLGLLAESMIERSGQKGDVVCAENSDRSSLGIVLEGALAVFGGPASREQLFFHLFAFDVFGEAEFFDSGLSLGRTAIVSKTATYAELPHDAVRAIGMRDPRLFLALGAFVAQRNRGLAATLAAHVSKSILARVALALLPYATPARGLEQAISPLQCMTQAQVAASAGTVKEVAARAIAELERLGALRREHGHICYLDRSELLKTIDS